MKTPFQTLPVLKDLKKEDLTYFGYRVEPYFASDIILLGMLNKMAIKKIFDWDTTVRWLQIDFQFFQFRHDLEMMESELKKSLQEKGILYVNSVVKQCIEYGDALIKASKELGAKAAEIKDEKELARELEVYFKAMTTYTAFYSMALFERPMMGVAETFAKKNTKSAEDEHRLFDLITTSSRETAVEYEQEDFLNLASKMGGASGISDPAALETHAKKHGWLAIRFFVGTPWTAENILARLKIADPTASGIELKRRLQERKDRELRIAKAIENFSQQDKEIVSQIREVVFLRNQRADYYNESAYHIRPLLEKIASVIGITYTDLLNLSSSEIISALKGKFAGLSELKDKIGRRKQLFVVYHDGDSSLIVDGIEAEAYIKEKPFLMPEQESAKEVMGKVGFKGKVTGPARIVKLEADIPKVQEGDILVAPMTIPNFMPAMEKAIAFVTDEGGITCHAAIVAREMQKPCVIGTKIATQVFKDGDMIEVDAEKGVVRKLDK